MNSALKADRLVAAISRQLRAHVGHLLIAFDFLKADI
jgi:hypothetical protein